MGAARGEEVHLTTIHQEVGTAVDEPTQ